jgi:hypothetical protein
MDDQARKSITNSIDKGLLKNLDNFTLSKLNLSLEARIRTINRIIEKEFNVPIVNDKSKNKVEFLLLNIVHLEKRIEDISWLLNKKREFKYSDKMMFKLLLLKDKINET